jgi:hypothetical protein
MRHLLALPVATAILVVAGSSTASAQLLPAQQTQEPPSPVKPSSTTGADPAERPHQSPESRPLTLFENRTAIGVRTNSVLESWLANVEMKCIGCPGLDTAAIRSPPTDAYAPWVLETKWRRSTPLGAVSTGFVGVRNGAVPLSFAMPLGGEVDPNVINSWRSNVVAPSIRWSLTAAVEKTLVTSKGGATVGIAADVVIPVGAGSTMAGDPRMSALASRTLRFGIVFRW